jgi:DNA-binding beta-propeller fold protein YncE
MKISNTLSLLLILSAISSLSCQSKTANPTAPAGDFTSLPLFLNQWCGNGAGNGQFSQLEGITSDSVGNIYACDAGNSRIEKFDPTGKLLSQWGSPGSIVGAFNNPTGIAVTGNDVYITDSGNNRVQEFDTSGNYITGWGSTGAGVSLFNNPQGIAVDQYSDVYVVDQGNDRIQKFFAGGAAPLTWGSAGSGPASFNSPTGIALDNSGNVYVTDTLNNRVQRFTPTGTYQNTWGAYGTNPAQFRSPEGITFDASGNIYVADSANGRIQKFDASFNYLSQWGGLGSNIGQFQVPFSIAITSSPTYFYIADIGTNCVKRFGPPAEYSIFPNPVMPGENLTISFNSAYYIGYLIQITDMNGTVVFNDLGQAVAGNNAVQWNVMSGGTRVQTGVYLLDFTLGHTQVSEKISVVN